MELNQTETLKDIKEIITCFDNFLDNIYDRGCFDKDTLVEDNEIYQYVEEMKQKYHVK